MAHNLIEFANCRFLLVTGLLVLAAGACGEQVREVRDTPQHKLRLAAARCGTD